MKLVKVEIELVIDDNNFEMVKGLYNKDYIAGYLNSKLYNDPEFFGEFGAENITNAQEFE